MATSTGGLVAVTRRHRIHEDEVPEVIKGLVLRLREHMNIKEDLEAATLCFRCLWRLEEHKTGRPDYPDATWGFMEDYVGILEEQPEPEVWQYEPLDPDLKYGTITPKNALQEGGHET